MLTIVKNQQHDLHNISVKCSNIINSTLKKSNYKIFKKYLNSIIEKHTTLFKHKKFQTNIKFKSKKFFKKIFSKKFQKFKKISKI